MLQTNYCFYLLDFTFILDATDLGYFFWQNILTKFLLLLQLKGGIPAHRYRLRPDVFNNSKVENLCYCNVTNSCSVQGALDISPCPSGMYLPAKLSSSFPIPKHFNNNPLTNLFFWFFSSGCTDCAISSSFPRFER